VCRVSVHVSEKKFADWHHVHNNTIERERGGERNTHEQETSKPKLRILNALDLCKLKGLEKSVEPIDVFLAVELLQLLRKQGVVSVFFSKCNCLLVLRGSTHNLRIC